MVVLPLALIINPSLQPNFNPNPTSTSTSTTGGPVRRVRAVLLHRLALPLLGAGSGARRGHGTYRSPLFIYYYYLFIFILTMVVTARRTVLQVRGPVSAGQGLGTAARDVPARLRAGIVIIRIVIIL
jgi:hypothetical protein